MYLTPIIYPLDIIPKKYMPFMKINPMYYIVECFRQPIFLGELPSLDTFYMAIFVAGATLWVGYKVFTKLSDSFVYYVWFYVIAI